MNGGLFALARVQGRAGSRTATRDEIVCALKVATVDEVVADPRFRPGGRFGHFSFSPRADRSDVERTVRDRYLSLAAVDDDHFVAPGRSDALTGSGYGSARAASAISTRQRWTRRGRLVAAAVTSPGPWRERRPPSTI